MNFICLVSAIDWRAISVGYTEFHRTKFDLEVLVVPLPFFKSLEGCNIPEHRPGAGSVECNMALKSYTKSRERYLPKSSIPGKLPPDTQIHFSEIDA